MTEQQQQLPDCPMCQRLDEVCPRCKVAIRWATDGIADWLSTSVGGRVAVFQRLDTTGGITVSGVMQAVAEVLTIGRSLRSDTEHGLQAGGGPTPDEQAHERTRQMGYDDGVRAAKQQERLPSCHLTSPGNPCGLCQDCKREETTNEQ